MEFIIKRYKMKLKAISPHHLLENLQESTHSWKKSLRWPVEVETIVLSKKLRVYLSDSNGIWAHNHLVCKRTLNHLAKLVIQANYKV